MRILERGEWKVTNMASVFESAGVELGSQFGAKFSRKPMVNVQFILYSQLTHSEVDKRN